MLLKLNDAKLVKVKNVQGLQGSKFEEKKIKNFSEDYMWILEDNPRSK